MEEQVTQSCHFQLRGSPRRPAASASGHEHQAGPCQFEACQGGGTEKSTAGPCAHRGDGPVLPCVAHWAKRTKANERVEIRLGNSPAYTDR